MRNKQEKRNRINSRTYKILGLLLIPLLSLIAVIPGVMAHCPLCTTATIIGVGVTRSFGLDDSIVGVFVGAMIVSSALWLNNALKKLKRVVMNAQRLHLFPGRKDMDLCVLRHLKELA